MDEAVLKRKERILESIQSELTDTIRSLQSKKKENQSLDKEFHYLEPKLYELKKELDLLEENKVHLLFQVKEAEEKLAFLSRNSSVVSKRFSEREAIVLKRETSVSQIEKTQSRITTELSKKEAHLIRETERINRQRKKIAVACEEIIWK